MSNIKINIPGVNTEEGLALCGDDLKTYLLSLRLYTSNMPKKLEVMRNVTEKNLRDYTVNAHSAKSISEYIGAQKIKQTAQQLEQMGKDGDLSGILAINNAFIKDAESILEGIQKWLKENKALLA